MGALEILAPVRGVLCAAECLRALTEGAGPWHSSWALRAACRALREGGSVCHDAPQCCVSRAQHQQDAGCARGRALLATLRPASCPACVCPASCPACMCPASCPACACPASCPACACPASCPACVCPTCVCPASCPACVCLASCPACVCPASCPAYVPRCVPRVSMKLWVQHAGLCAGGSPGQPAVQQQPASLWAACVPHAQHRRRLRLTHVRGLPSMRGTRVPAHSCARPLRTRRYCAHLGSRPPCVCLCVRACVCVLRRASSCLPPAA